MMLVLSRKENEWIQIGDEIVLTITAIKGNRVSVGIEAPDDVAIRRGELHARTSSTHDLSRSKPRQRQVA
ncbi:carbon storage regulator [Stieleria mannarensis]|uniref:carbon storage regulator n=1 Tax=Stieleria mannarensis TaxID=2755585 RepID=UPI002570BE86|nr:carbon storage regulator [Rhodopirellula sp. JC639]